MMPVPVQTVFRVFVGPAMSSASLALTTPQIRKSGLHGFSCRSHFRCEQHVRAPVTHVMSEIVCTVLPRRINSEQIKQRPVVATVRGLQCRNVSRSGLTPAPKVRSPLKLFGTGPTEEKVAHGAGKSAIPVWKRMYIHQAMVKPVSFIFQNETFRPS
jgi:hypothetical protein